MKKEDVVIAKNVYKKFRFGSAKTLKDLYAQFSQGRKPQEFWALKDVSFTVKEGDTFGIVGRNGSGKSTLLKLISRIMKPTKGTIETFGRISPLIELGAGFHGDLTGKENIFLNGSILGMKTEAIKKKFDDIVKFSGIAEFLDTPVKHYSSGMYARLGFSIAIHADPNILIVDEVLAVGDIAFQEKCFSKINELKRKGVTIIMVSHANKVIQDFCTKAIWLEKGEVKKEGSADYVARSYQEEVENELAVTAQRRQKEGRAQIAIKNVEFLQEEKKTRVFNRGEKLTARIHFSCRKPITDPIFAIVIFTENGIVLSDYNTFRDKKKTGKVSTKGFIDYTISHLPLKTGTYLVTAAVFDKDQKVLDYHDQAYQFKVKSLPFDPPNGIIRFQDFWDVPKHTKDS